MEKEKAIKGFELHKEIEELKKYKTFLTGEYKDSAHFEIVQHYGNAKDWQRIIIYPKHNPLLFEMIDQIIEDLESDLAEL